MHPISSYPLQATKWLQKNSWFQNLISQQNFRATPGVWYFAFTSPHQSRRFLPSLTIRLFSSLSNVSGTGSGESQCNDDLACLTKASLDRHGLDAIRSLHRQLDDDANGAIDLSESDEVRPYVSFSTGLEINNSVK